MGFPSLSQLFQNQIRSNVFQKQSMVLIPSDLFYLGALDGIFGGGGRDPQVLLRGMRIRNLHPLDRRRRGETREHIFPDLLRFFGGGVDFGFKYMYSKQ